MKQGFTLIELLIVVAIIAILAAIAVPNFLEAQTRSKVSRCMADMRSLATGLESYATVYNGYPPYGRIATDDSIEYPATVNNLYDKMCFCGDCLTTPIAFITSFFDDPFATNYQMNKELMRKYEYLNLKQHLENFPNPPPDWTKDLLPWWGYWRMVGAGPDQDRGVDIKLNIVYDPTNGTISDGDIVRSQARSGNSPHP